jgi:eukaryotic-like serine/threonine-protein kinase
MRVLKEGTRLADRYVLARRLGAGGMSEVWLARDDASGMEVALKFLLPDLAAQQGYRELFYREWQVGSRLMHPHIARVFEYHDDPDGPYYGQQYIGGPEIRLVAGQGPVDALRPLVLIADALRYAHAKGVVHRDIKAANVLLDRRGLPYLIDFGVAKAADGLPASGGTAVASSPQQRANEAPTPADDVYALGVLIHEILVGAPPGDDGAVVLRPGSSRIGDDVRGLLRDMLAADADRRPSVAEVAERLKAAGIAPGPALLAGPPAGAPSDEDIVVAETVRLGRGKRGAQAPPVDAGDSGGVPARLVFGGLAVLLVLVISVVFVLPGAVQKERDRATVPEATQEEAADADEAEPATAPSEEAPPAGATQAELRAAADDALGEMLSNLERLRERAVERWGGRAWEEALAAYEQGDDAYLHKDYRLAAERYRAADGLLAPLFDRVQRVFDQAMADAEAAFAARDHSEAVRQYDLAVAIRPEHAAAKDGLARARNLEAVLNLTNQALTLEDEIDLEAAKTAFERALDLDPEWEPAVTGLARVKEAIRQESFRQRMTEGLEALAAGDHLTARAAFNAAKGLNPDSQEPIDGLLQVDQGVRLARIQTMEQEAAALEEGEQWQAAAEKYEEILEVDPDLQFARDGLAHARQRANLHSRLQGYIADPDSLSRERTMQAATALLLEISRMDQVGPRLEDEKEELSRLLKRAATPLKVQLVSDNATEVAIYQVGRLGTFSSRELSLRPGSYVATGTRVGYRDVRLEFRVAPETDLDPIVIMCEERI